MDREIALPFLADLLESPIERLREIARLVYDDFDTVPFDATFILTMATAVKGLVKNGRIDFEDLESIRRVVQTASRGIEGPEKP